MGSEEESREGALIIPSFRRSRWRLAGGGGGAASNEDPSVVQKNQPGFSLCWAAAAAFTLVIQSGRPRGEKVFSSNADSRT